MIYEEMKINRMRRTELGRIITDSESKTEAWKRHYIKEKMKAKHWLPWLNLAARRGIITRLHQVEMLLCFEAKGTFTVESFELARALWGLIGAMWFKAGRPWWAATNFPCVEFEVMFVCGYDMAKEGLSSRKLPQFMMARNVLNCFITPPP